VQDAMEMGSQQELEQRLALARPEDTIRGFFFNGALAVVRGLEDEVALNRCIEAAGGNSFLTFFSYPVSSLNQLLYTAAWVLSEKHGGFTGAMRYLGHRVAPDYLASAAGRALLLLSGREPKRMLDNLPMAYRTSVQHGECSLRWNGPSSGTIVIRGNTLPMEYFEGSVQGFFESTKMTQMKALGRGLSLSDWEIDVSW
jgi:uncharacterized protein (TIGR02265 family)